MLDKVDFTKPPKLAHLLFLMDDKGIVQHTKQELPTLEHGYSIDDQARALLVVTKCQKLFQERPTENLTSEVGLRLRHTREVYLNYIRKAKSDGDLFNNFMRLDGIFENGEKSQDSLGRVIWTLGYIISNNPNKLYIDIYRELIDYSSSYIDQLQYSRSKSYSLIGLSYLNLSRNPKHSFQDKLVVLEKEIIKNFQKSDNWSWFENFLTYANAIIPYSLLHSYQVTKNQEALRIALNGLDFLDKVCVVYPQLRSDSSEVKYFPGPIGNRGWYPKGGERAIYDQQVIDVADMVLAHAQAYKITKNREHLDKSLWWFDWFYGNNINSIKMVDEESGAVFDGLTKEGRNENRGAESVICYLLAYLELSEIFLNRQFGT